MNEFVRLTEATRRIWLDEHWTGRAWQQRPLAGNKLAAATKRLKRRIETRLRRILDGRHVLSLDRLSPDLLERLIRDRTILEPKGQPGRGSVYWVRLSDLKQLLPELFPIEWNHAAREVREYIAGIEAWRGNVETEIGAVADGDWALYELNSDRIWALEVAVLELQRQLSDALQQLSERSGGHRRTEEGGFPPEGGGANGFASSRSMANEKGRSNGDASGNGDVT